MPPLGRFRRGASAASHGETLQTPAEGTLLGRPPHAARVTGPSQTAMDERPLTMGSTLERIVIGGQLQWCYGSFPWPGAKVAYNAEQRLAADCLQPPLRSGFRQQLKAGVRLQKAGCPGVNICRNIQRNIQRYWIS